MRIDPRTFLDRGEVPILPGVWTADGRFHAAVDPGGPESPTTLTCVERQPDMAGDAGCSLIGARTIDSGDWKIVVGEGSHGSDGVVALLDADSNFHWLAFFDFSNPFEHAEIADGCVRAINNLGETWIFPVDAPWRIVIEPSAT